jgi:hypothetical protein
MKPLTSSCARRFGNPKEAKKKIRLEYEGNYGLTEIDNGNKEKRDLTSVHKMRKNIAPQTYQQTTRITDQSEKLPLYTASF